MKRSSPIHCLLIAAVFLSLMSINVAPVSAAKHTAALTLASRNPRAAGTLANAAVLFTENVGQIAVAAGIPKEAQPRFQVRGAYGSLYFSSQAMVVSFQKRGSSSTESVNVRLSFVGANSNPRIVGFDRQSTHVSYFIGNDPKQWHADIPVWGGVRYEDLYPGLDLEITSQGGHWVWRIVRRDNQSPLSAVRLRVEGADALELSDHQLRVSTRLGGFELPLLQIAGNDPTNLGVLSLVGNEVLSPFQDAAGHAASELYKPAPGSMRRPPFTGSGAPLASVDPVNLLFYSTYLGGSGPDCYSETGSGSLCKLAVNANGEVYVVGQTESNDFTQNVGVGYHLSPYGSSDVFVVKLNPGGHGTSDMEYATYLGGSNYDLGNAIALGPDGSAYVTGFTASSDFPYFPATAYETTHNGNPGDQNPFMTELNPTGTALVYSTYLGVGQGQGIALDSNRKVYLTGQATSTFTMTANAYQQTFGGGTYDGFVARLNTSGNGQSDLEYATYIGGSANDCEESGDLRECDIAVDASGNAYVVGVTYSSNFIPTPPPNGYDHTFHGTADVFVIELNLSLGPAGLVYATYLGGSNTARCLVCAIALDQNNMVYVVGQTNSSDFNAQTSGKIQSYQGGLDAFLVELNPTVSGAASLLYGTFMGGTANDWARSIAIGSDGTVNVGGYTLSTKSTGFPITAGTFNGTQQGSRDGFAMRLDLSLTGTSITSATTPLLYSTFFGGGADDWISGVATRPGESQTLYVNGGTQSSGSTPISTTVGAYQTTSPGVPDGFVTKLAVPSSWSQVYYVGDPTKLGAIGQALGLHDQNMSGTQDHLVVLDFGHPQKKGGEWGTQMVGFTTTFVSVNTVITSSVQFASSYFQNLGLDKTSHLQVVVGTTNDIAFSTAASWIQGHGAAWAQMVDTIRSQVAACCGSQVSVVGGSDMETEIPPVYFTGPYSTTLWVNSYVSASSCIPGSGDAGCLYDYGINSADSSNSCATVPTNTWTYCDVWYISWGVKKGGARMDRPLPQIYDASGLEAGAWHNLSTYSINFKGDGMITPVGTLTQRGACQQVTCDPNLVNTTGQGWLQLWGALYADPTTRVANLHWLMDIKYQCLPLGVKKPTCSP